VLNSFRATELLVLLARPLALANAPTLAELGQSLGVTRERVRQIEARGLKKLQEALNRPENLPLYTRAHQFAARFGPACPVIFLLASHPFILATAEEAITDDVAEARLLLWIEGPYEIKGGWLVRAPYEELLRKSAELLDELTSKGGVPYEQAVAALARLEIIDAFRGAWLSDLRGFRILEGQFVRWRGTLVDKVETVLRRYGRPMTRAELWKAIGRSSPSVIARPALSDPRFTRSSLKHIALREWGLDSAQPRRRAKRRSR
jgi:hypothetical protein